MVNYRNFCISSSLDNFHDIKIKIDLDKHEGIYGVMLDYKTQFKAISDKIINEHMPKISKPQLEHMVSEQRKLLNAHIPGQCNGITESDPYVNLLLNENDIWICSICCV